MNRCNKCGAPVDNAIGKCPYCGTSYFDVIDLDKKPMTVRFDFAGSEITCKGLIRATTLRMEPDAAPVLDMEMMIVDAIEQRRRHVR